MLRASTAVVGEDAGLTQIQWERALGSGVGWGSQDGNPGCFLPAWEEAEVQAAWCLVHVLRAHQLDPLSLSKSASFWL